MVDGIADKIYLVTVEIFCKYIQFITSIYTIISKFAFGVNFLKYCPDVFEKHCFAELSKVNIPKIQSNSDTIYII